MKNNIKFIELVPGTKRPITNFQNLHNSVDKLKDAGLVLTEDLVIVDFDKREDIARQIIDKYKINAVKTNRGYHLYFKYPTSINIEIKNTSKVITVLGCEVDYKTGYNKSNAYGVIKQNGKEREKINWSEKLKELPTFLYPTKNKVNLSEIEEGNRNEEIFKHLTTVKKYYNNAKDFETLAITINNILINPLSEKEIKEISKYVYNRKVEEFQPYYILNKNAFDLWINKMLSNAAIKIYILMIDRHRQTIFEDEQGKKFFVMTFNEIKEITKITNRETVQKAINQLEKYELIKTNKENRKATKYYII